MIDIKHNDLCSCGSGKNYKKCCGSSSTSPNNASGITNGKWLELAQAQFQAGQYGESAASYRQYLQVDPNHSGVCYNLALALQLQGNLLEAIQYYNESLSLQPLLFPALQNLGNALHTLNRLDEAASHYQRALAIKPNHTEILNNLGIVLKDQGYIDQAIQYYERAIQHDPNYAKAYTNLGNAFKELGLLDEAISCYQRTLEINPTHIEALSNQLFVMSFHPQYTEDQYLAVAKHFASIVSAKSHPYKDWPALDDTCKILRVGMVSGDFRTHPVGFFLENILYHLVGSSLQLVAYSTKPQEDELTARIKPYFTEWHTLTGLTDAQAAHKIHSDGIHLLIDLAGHTAHNRLPIFAWKPAPVQISWLGYFASTGLSQIDYLLADRIAVPQTHHSHFVEKIAELPDTRLCFTAPESIEVGPLPVINSGHITFGCFQNLSKLNEKVLSTWAQILLELPDSKIRLQNNQLNSAAIKKFLMEKLTMLEISVERVILVEPVSRHAYLSAYSEVDIILDTFPYPGGTTTCEALWMGVPTITLCGSTLLSRQGASILSNAGLSDWIAKDESDYVNKAVTFSKNLQLLSDIRMGMRNQIQGSPLFDSHKFSLNLEKTLRTIWHEKTGY